jgi:Holliday junction resolvase
MAELKVKEKWVKKKVVDYLKSHGLYYFFPVASGWMSAGVPDIICCVKGRFVGIECKAGKNKPTAIQLKNHREIQLNEGHVMVINEDNLDHMKEVIDELIRSN